VTAFIPILYHTIINGIIVTRHLAASNVTPAKLDFTGTTTFTNPGTGGGSGFYINLGGLKILVVKDCQAATDAWKTIDYTAVGFTAVPYVAGNSIKQGTSTSGGWIEFTSKTAPSSNSPEQNGLSFLCRNASGNTGGKIDVLIIGK